jgi:hypothetical protein
LGDEFAADNENVESARNVPTAHIARAASSGEEGNEDMGMRKSDALLSPARGR